MSSPCFFSMGQLGTSILPIFPNAELTILHPHSSPKDLPQPPPPCLLKHLQLTGSLQYLTSLLHSHPPLPLHSSPQYLPSLPPPCLLKHLHQLSSVPPLPPYTKLSPMPYHLPPLFSSSQSLILPFLTAFSSTSSTHLLHVFFSTYISSPQYLTSLPLQSSP